MFDDKARVYGLYIEGHPATAYTAPGLKHLRQLLRRIVRRSGEVQNSIKHDSHEAHGLPVKRRRGDFLAEKQASSY